MDSVIDYSNTQDNWNTYESYPVSENTLRYEDGLFAGLFGTFFVLSMLIAFAAAVIGILSTWKIFTKAHEEGWKSIIPVYNFYTLFEIVGLKGWYAFLIFIPFIGAAILGVFSIIAYIKLARSFGKDTGFAIGLILLPIVFMPLLAFGTDEYIGPDGVQTE